MQCLLPYRRYRCNMNASEQFSSEAIMILAGTFTLEMQRGFLLFIDDHDLFAI